MDEAAWDAGLAEDDMDGINKPKKHAARRADSRRGASSTEDTRDKATG